MPSTNYTTQPLATSIENTIRDDEIAMVATDEISLRDFHRPRSGSLENTNHRQDHLDHRRLANPQPSRPIRMLDLPYKSGKSATVSATTLFNHLGPATTKSASSKRERQQSPPSVVHHKRLRMEQIEPAETLSDGNLLSTPGTTPPSKICRSIEESFLDPNQISATVKKELVEIIIVALRMRYRQYMDKATVSWYVANAVGRLRRDVKHAFFQLDINNITKGSLKDTLDIIEEDFDDSFSDMDEIMASVPEALVGIVLEVLHHHHLESVHEVKVSEHGTTARRLRRGVEHAFLRLGIDKDIEEYLKAHDMSLAKFNGIIFCTDDALLDLTENVEIEICVLVDTTD